MHDISCLKADQFQEKCETIQLYINFYTSVFYYIVIAENKATLSNMEPV